MKINAPATRTLAAALLLLVSVAFDAPAQNRPAPPRPSTIRRPSATPAGAAPRAATQPSGGGVIPVIPVDDSPNALNYQDASIYLVIMDYAMRKGLTPIFAPGISPDTKVTLRSVAECPLDDEQYLMAIEQVLNLNGIALEVKDEKFLKVVPSAEFRKHGVKTVFSDPETGETVVNPERGQFVSQMVELKYIDIAEAQGIITGFVRTGAQIQAIERSNSILITDSADTVNRIVEVLKYVDKPIIERETPNFIQIRYAKAADIKARIEEIVKSAQEEQSGKKSSMPQERSSGAPGTERRTLPPGVTLPGRREPEPARKGAETFEALVAEAQRGIIRGKVSIIADERTNLLIIITRPENMVFFNKVIEQLDIPTAPEVVVEVHRLEHAVAKEAAALLNELIGNKKASENDARPTARRDGDSPTPAAAAARAAESSDPGAGGDAKTKFGQLDSENIKILADERTNALIIMANYGDMLVIRDIIQSMDIMLSQVVIETVIVSLNFKDEAQTGIDWVQRAMIAGTSDEGDGPAVAFASAGGGGTLTPAAALRKTTTDSLTGYGAGATLVTTLFDFNVDLIVKAVATDSRARLMNAPLITTLDNKEAILESTERIYYSEGTTYYSNSDNSTKNIKNEDIGIKLKVTPRINKKGYIVLTIEQEWQDLGSGQIIDGENLPTVNTRKMGSDVAVQSGQTVVLGGLASNSDITSKSKIPLLGDIPLLGWFFRSTSVSKSRNEIVIFLTPRVIDTPGQIEDEARGRKAVLDTDGIWNSGWSNSRLADPITEKEERKLIERGRDTVMPPRYPLTRHLTELNREHGLQPEVAPTNRVGSRYGYSHFSDIPIDEDRMVSAETPAPATAEPATAPEAPAPAEPATTPEAQVPAEAPASPAPAVSPDASPPRLATPPEPATAPEAPAAAEPAAEAPASAIDQRIQDILGQ
ncbi:MAG: type II secretion system secretin GspD [Lentisphaerae bacterium]|nr:type II secretion system secretin GspD [Lentisphaerota bacterium]